MKKIALMAFTAALFFLPGCAAFNQGLTEYTLPDEEPGEREVTESSIDTLANEYHAKAVLDPNYLSEHGYNTSTFAAQVADTQAGIAQAKANYATAEAKYSYWAAVIDSIDVNALSDEFYATADSLDTLLYSIAEAKEMSLSEMISEYGMTDEDLSLFLADAKEMMGSGFTLTDILDSLETDVDETKEELINILLTVGGDDAESEEDADVLIAETSDDEKDNDSSADNASISYYSVGALEDADYDKEECEDEEEDDIINSSYEDTTQN